MQTALPTHRRWPLSLTGMALAAAAALAGCASAPPTPGAHRPAWPADASFETTAVTTPLDIDRWWTLFDDPQLDRHISDALARNADLAVAAARLREARAQLDQAAAAEGPRADLQATSGRIRSPSQPAGLPEGAARTGGAHRAALTAEHELDLWGRLGAGTQAARERLQAQAWARASVAWSLTAQVAEAHFARRALDRQLAIAQAVRLGRQREVMLRSTELQAGAGAELLLRRAQAELASADATVAALSRRSLAVHNVLALLTGVPLEELARAWRIDAQPLDPSQPFETRLPSGALAQLLVRRPDVRQAEAELLAARADVAAARAGTLPAVRLSGSVGSDVRELSSLFTGAGFAWTLASSLVQSVFDGGRSRAQVHQTEARSDAARARYQRTVAAALSDVREAYLAVDLDAQALQAEQARVASLARALALARIGQQAGVSAPLDTLDAERNHFQAQLAEVDAYRGRLLGQVAVFKALGGGPFAAAGTDTAAATTVSHPPAPAGASL